jgi:hypothetical protein
MPTRRLGTASGNEPETRYSSGYENEDYACQLPPRVYSLADARVVTLHPPVHTKLSCIASRMATQRDVEFNQMFLNACVYYMA